MITQPVLHTLRILLAVLTAMAIGLSAPAAALAQESDEGEGEDAICVVILGVRICIPPEDQ